MSLHARTLAGCALCKDIECCVGNDWLKQRVPFFVLNFIVANMINLFRNSGLFTFLNDYQNVCMPKSSLCHSIIAEKAQFDPGYSFSVNHP